MVRRRKKISLYEVISRSQPKSGNGKESTGLPPEESATDEPTIAKPSPVTPEAPAQWPRKPRILQFNAGRVEISVSYQLAIALLLGIVLLVLVVFRLGQISYFSKKQTSKKQTSNSTIKTEKIEQNKPAKLVIAGVPQVAKAAEKVPPSVKKSEPPEPEGNNRIVIQTYELSTHLEPVKQFFTRFGIETEIKKIDNWYYLVTKSKYDNPQRPGTDGYSAKQRIIELGAQYKAPAGYETFGKNPFHDAYGMKFEN